MIELDPTTLVSMPHVLLLLVVFQVKHFLADYPLQGHYMLGKFRAGWDYVPPLAAHCSVHALFTLAIVASWQWHVLGEYRWEHLVVLPLIDFISHFIMDRIKASPKLLGRFKPLASAGDYLYAYDYKHLDRRVRQQWWGNKFFWWSLGLDQMVHHLTNYFIIWRLLLCSTN